MERLAAHSQILDYWLQSKNVLMQSCRAEYSNTEYKRPQIVDKLSGKTGFADA